MQHDETDCGVACISIILQFYGKNVPLRKIREVCGTDSSGTSGYGIIKGAERFGLFYVPCKIFFSLLKQMEFAQSFLYGRFECLNVKSATVYASANLLPSACNFHFRRIIAVRFPENAFLRQWRTVFSEEIP